MASHYLCLPCAIHSTMYDTQTRIQNILECSTDASRNLNLLHFTLHTPTTITHTYSYTHIHVDTSRNKQDAINLKFIWLVSSLFVLGLINKLLSVYYTYRQSCQIDRLMICWWLCSLINATVLGPHLVLGLHKGCLYVLD